MDRFPRIPKTVHAPAGPVPVVRVRDLRDENGKQLYGLWVPDPRCIQLERGLSPHMAWQVLFHEQFHAWMSDNGIDLELGKSKCERLCDLYASTLMAEWLAGRRKS